jgi:hypothetical protein
MQDEYEKQNEFQQELKYYDLLFLLLLVLYGFFINYDGILLIDEVIILEVLLILLQKILK